MPRTAHILWIITFSLLLVTCARDVNPDVTEVPYPDQVRIAFSTSQTFSSDYWYYMVFNYSAAPNTSSALAPLDEVSGVDRATNWEMYIAYHKDPTSGDTLVALQRPRVPTVLATAVNPVDVAVGLATDDAVNDLLVACYAGDTVQLIQGIDPDPNDPAYFETATTFDTGPHPLRLDVADYTGDGLADVCIAYAGKDAAPAVLRVLAQTAAGVFAPGVDTPITDTPISAVVADVSGDTQKDWAILTRNSSTQAMNVRIYLGDGHGGFSEAHSFGVDSSAVQLILGQVNGSSTGLDLVVAQRGASGGSGSVAIFNGDGTGAFSTGPVQTIDGNVNSVALGGFLETAISSLLVGYTGTDNAGHVDLLLNNGEQQFTYHSTLTVPTSAAYVTAFDTNADTVPEAVILDGNPATNTGNTLYFVRGKRKLDLVSGKNVFTWDSYLIDYLTGTAPTAVLTQDLNGDGVVDLLIPNSGTGNNGNSVCVFHGLGHTNYTNADIYWTDDLPNMLDGHEWLLSQSISNNLFDITIDPGVFYDLALLPPEQGRGFNVTFMTATRGIYWDADPNQDGEVRDVLLHPINIPMEVGYQSDEQNEQLANLQIASDPSADINNWRVEVN
jgi:hypothetical protein